VTLKAAVFASGRGSTFQVLAEYGAKKPGRKWEVALLVTNRADAYVLDRARALGVPSVVLDSSSMKDGEAIFPERLRAVLEAAEIDLILLSGYLKLVPEGTVRTYRGRMLNIHPALLPGFGGKGMYGRRVHEAVIESGARVTGVTVHFVDEVYDRGRIFAQWPVPVVPGDTADSLAARVLEVEHALYPAAVDHLADAITNETEPVPIPGPKLTNFGFVSEPSST
jgi:formyltetrahydrofolate-dependent phosphoribosylglycinamide formyltransferase